MNDTIKWTEIELKEVIRQSKYYAKLDTRERARKLLESFSKPRLDDRNFLIEILLTLKPAK